MSVFSQFFFDNEFIKEITDVEKDQLKDKIKT